MMNKIKILFLISNMKVGGAQEVLINLINNLDRVKFSPLLLSLGNESDPQLRFLHNDIIQYIYKRKYKFDLGPQKKVNEIVSKHNIDIIVSINLFPAIYCLSAIKKSPNIKLLLSYHTTIPSSIKEKILTHLYFRIYYKKIELLPICQKQKEYNIKNYKIYEPKIHQPLYNGIDTDYWSLPPSDFKKEELFAQMGITNDAKVILNVSSINPKKRHDLMIKALAQLKVISAKNKKYYLIFIGDGTKKIKKKLLKMVSDLNLNNDVIFLGNLHEFRKYYWMSDLFVLASTSVETYSMAVLQGMACGLPAAITDIGCASEIIKDTNGYLVEPNNVEALANTWKVALDNIDKFDARDIREHIVRNNSIKTFVNCYEKFFENIIK